jgi:hypothetical protein
MTHLKGRLLALILIIVFGALTYYNWHQLLLEGRYSFKLATFGPVGIVGGFFLLIFPGLAGKPTTTKERVVVLAVFVVGLAAGVINLYLMDPGMFSFK